MKKVFLFFSLIIILSFGFNMQVRATDSAVDMSRLVQPVESSAFQQQLVQYMVSYYRSNNPYALEEPEASLYYIASTYSKDGHPGIQFYCSPDPFEVTSFDSGGNPKIQREDRTSIYFYRCYTTTDDMSGVFKISKVGSTSPTIDVDEYFYTSDDVYYAVTNSLIFDNASDTGAYIPDTDFGAFGSLFDDLANAVDEETLTDTDSTSDSNVFLRIFQSMTGIQSNIGKLVNSIAFHISEISSNLDSYMNDIIQNGFNGVKGLLEDILAAIKDIAVAALPENLVTMIDQLYESGLDADGNFGVDTMLGYWFVPDPDSMHDMFSEAINSSSEFAEILDFAEWFKQHLVDLEPVAPMFTIQPGEYGFITIKNEIRISFEWFEVWKPYTDPLIAAFLYITYFWHLFMSIPGILNGTAATTYAATHMQEPNVPLVSNWRNGVFRK